MPRSCHPRATVGGGRSGTQPTKHMCINTPGLPWRLGWQRIRLQCRGNPDSIPGGRVEGGTVSWGREWQPTAVFLPGKSHGQRSLVGYSPWGLKELGRTEATYTHIHLLRTKTRIEMWRRLQCWIRHISLPGNTAWKRCLKLQFGEWDERKQEAREHVGCGCRGHSLGPVIADFGKGWQCHTCVLCVFFTRKSWNHPEWLRILNSKLSPGSCPDRWLCLLSPRPSRSASGGWLPSCFREAP